MNRSLIASLAVVATIAVAPTALASSDQQRHADQSSPGGIGGLIYVDGAGSVRVNGSFLAFGDVGGMNVTVTDRGGDARVILGGKRMQFPRRAKGQVRTKVRTMAFQPGDEQRVSIEGRNVSASFRGDGNVTLSITGTGTVKLDGVGTFRVNSRRVESWPMAAIALPLGSTSRRPR